VSITPGVQRNDDSAILLTGATGFLGGEVLARLLEHGQRAVCALVRAHDQAGAQRRLDRVIDSLGLDRDAVGDRATAIAGDVTEPLLGLDTRSRAELAERTGRIIHCAASVSFTLGLDESRQINVGGTSRMLDLAEFCVRVGGGLDSFVHVSTAYVAGRHPEPFSEADLDRGQEFRNAYERSKFEAELAVAERAATLPVQVVRPSIVVGDSRTGWTSSFNVVYGPLRAFDRGAFPVLPARASAPVDIVPVDFVADAIVALAGRPRTTFNLTAGSRASSVGEIVELASAEAGRRPPRIVHPGIYRRAVHPLLVRTGGEVRRRALRRGLLPLLRGRGRFRRRAHSGRAGAARDRAAAASRLLRPADGLRPRRRLGEARAHPARRRRGARGTADASATSGAAARDPAAGPGPIAVGPLISRLPGGRRARRSRSRARGPHPRPRRSPAPAAPRGTAGNPPPTPRCR
jgi:thioester reductase-like protein